MSLSHPTTTSLSAELRPLIVDLAAHRGAIYWVDFLSSMTIFALAIGVALQVEPSGWMRSAAFMIAVLALYRAATFMHEIVHMPSGRLTGFRLGWNFLCGMLIFLPTFLYYSHLNHHAQPSYATQHDPEYLPFGQHPYRSWMILLGGTLLALPLLWCRFALLVPMSWLFPGMRGWLAKHASSITIRADFSGTGNWHPRRRAERRLFEPLMVGYAWMLAFVCWRNLVPRSAALLVVGCVLCTLLINAVRTRYAHHYESDGDAVSVQAQIEDTATHGRGMWLELLAPLGLRYHALHHLFPHLPYHSLKTAHERIVASPLPAAEVYRRTCSHSHRPLMTSFLFTEK